MYPVLFRIGDFEITTFGVLVAVAAIVGTLIFEREARRVGFADTAMSAAIAGVLGGLLGAKVVWAIEFSGTAPFASLLFSRGGLSWFGGFAGGVGAGLWVLKRHRVPLLQGLSAAAPALAMGHAIGRIGCFLVGDDYGKPTDLPWGVAFPEGLPPTDVRVHPTQLYETVLLVPLALLLMRWRRQGVPDDVVLARYFIAAGSIRFAIEFIRINRRLAGPFTLAQMIAATVVAIGAVLIVRARLIARPQGPRPRAPGLGQA